jgi:4-amino-4-deoxy-L-arabinose transferase-like glycosyltransferase
MSTPRSVRASFVFWLLAVAAGVLETILAATRQPEDAYPQVAIRFAIFAGAVFLAVNLLRGRPWARIAIAVLLSGVGLVSLVYEPIRWLLDGNSLTQAYADADGIALAFAGSRLLHVVAVLAATVLMFAPEANAYFRRRRALRAA